MNPILLLNPTYEDLKQTPIAQWITVLHTASGARYLNIRGKHCMICLEPRPDYCNRGRWQAKLEVLDSKELHVDWADGWDGGRYYFDLERAKAEVEAWLIARNQIEEGDRTP